MVTERNRQFLAAGRNPAWMWVRPIDACYDLRSS